MGSVASAVTTHACTRYVPASWVPRYPPLVLIWELSSGAITCRWSPPCFRFPPLSTFLLSPPFFISEAALARPLLRHSHQSDMPYNTRRKSLSLPSLGIHIPVTLAERAAASAASRLQNSGPKSSGAALPNESHPSKKLKRTHTQSSQSPPDNDLLDTTPSRPLGRRSYERSHPQSPSVKDETIKSIQSSAQAPWGNAEDDVVGAVLTQLKMTGNRPHQVHELAPVLAQKLPCVQMFDPIFLQPLSPPIYFAFADGFN